MVVGYIVADQFSSSKEKQAIDTPKKILPTAVEATKSTMFVTAENVVSSTQETTMATTKDNSSNGLPKVSLLLIGIDTRKDNYKGRSDSVIFVQYDPETHTLKKIPLMRDLYVEINGHGHQKLAHAYAYGGAPLLQETLQQNFGLDIDYYITWNFFDMQRFIDLIGGINLDIPNNELKSVNQLVYEINSESEMQLTESMRQDGVFHINGALALSYARIRKIGNGDFERTQRQQIVIEQVLKKLMRYSKTEIIELLDKFDLNMPTNIDTRMLLKWYQLLNIDGPIDINVENKLIPSDYSFRESKIDGLYYLVIKKDWDVKKEISEFLNKHTKIKSSLSKGFLSNCFGIEQK